MTDADLFENAPIPILREDWSHIRLILERLRSSGVVDIATHVAAHPELIREWRKLHRFVDANNATVRLFGAETKEQFLALAPALLPANVASNVKVLEAFERGCRFMEGERILHTLDGRTVPILWRGTILDENAGNILFYAFDITEQRRAQDALMAAEADLAHASRVAVLGELAASLAHEVNQPLSAITTFADAALRWLRHEPANLQEALQAISHVSQCASHAGDVVARIRAFVRKTPAAAAMICPAALAEAAFLLVEREASRRGVERIADIAPDLPPVAGDSVQLQQVMVNLMVNAIQAMAEANAPRRLLSVTVSPNANRTRVGFQVRDTGPGIPEAVRDRIFAPFFSTKQDSMGMGLAICRSIIRDHHGELEVETDAESGTCFRFWLPCAEAPGTPVDPLLP